jgi:pimeloyl-ACP methyl ester carboxylesterase
MASFSVELVDGKRLTGRNHFPINSSASRIAVLPLIVAVHGGTYTSDYFDADADHTLRHISQALAVPVVAIDRPGYRGTSPLPPIPTESTFIQEQGAYLHKYILPFLWKTHATNLGVSSIFLYAHSIGAAVAVVASSLHACDGDVPAYPLSGMSISGVGSNVKTLPMEAFHKDARELVGISIRIPNEQKDMLMLGPAKLHSPAILKQTERLQHDVSLEELYDINVSWRSYWRTYAANVKVPVLYTLGELDELWNRSDQDVEDFAKGFVNAPPVEARRLLSAPHCIEHSLQCHGLTLRTFGFAIECAVHHYLTSDKLIDQE